IAEARNEDGRGYWRGEVAMKFDMKVVHAGVYRHAQTGSQATDYFFVGFVYSGMKSLGMAGQPPVTHCPLLSLRAPGVTANFDFGPDRENWVVIVSTKDVRQSVREGMVELRCDDRW